MEAIPRRGNFTQGWPLARIRTESEWKGGGGGKRLAKKRLVLGIF